MGMTNSALPFEPMSFQTLDPMLWAPVGAGLWRQHELWDGTYDVQDLCDVLEYLEVKAENAHRLREYIETTKGKPNV